MNDDNRWDLAEIISKKGEFYRDYEGILDERDIVFVKDMVAQYATEEYLQGEELQVLRDIVGNLLVEYVMLVGIEVFKEEEWIMWTIATVEAVSSMLRTRYWTKSGIQWK